MPETDSSADDPEFEDLEDDDLDDEFEEDTDEDVDDRDYSEESFPWEHVEASRRDRSLQSEHDVVAAKMRYGDEQCCPRCSRSGDDLVWVYFVSPDWTWANLCGREGWLVVCDNCKVQVRFYVEVMN